MKLQKRIQFQHDLYSKNMTDLCEVRDEQARDTSDKITRQDPSLGEAHLLISQDLILAPQKGLLSFH